MDKKSIMSISSISWYILKKKSIRRYASYLYFTMFQFFFQIRLFLLPFLECTVSWLIFLLAQRFCQTLIKFLQLFLVLRILLAKFCIFWIQLLVFDFQIWNLIKTEISFKNFLSCFCWKTDLEPNYFFPFYVKFKKCIHVVTEGIHTHYYKFHQLRSAWRSRTQSNALPGASQCSGQGMHATWSFSMHARNAYAYRSSLCILEKKLDHSTFAKLVFPPIKSCRCLSFSKLVCLETTACYIFSG